MALRTQKGVRRIHIRPAGINFLEKMSLTTEKIKQNQAITLATVIMAIAALMQAIAIFKEFNMNNTRDIILMITSVMIIIILILIAFRTVYLNKSLQK